MEKHLKVNTAILDMITTKPETIEAYDEIKINCAMCLTSGKTRQLLSQGRIKINTANVIEVCEDENVKVITINGEKKMTADFTAPEEPTFLVVNGNLIIEDSAKKNLNQYKGVIVNGRLLHPMSFDTSNFNVNGASIPYPDGAILVFQSLELTNSFVKSAVQGATYFIQGMLSNLNALEGKSMEGISSMLKDMGLRAVEKLDLDALKSKNIRFYTGWVTTIEENAEQVMQIVDGSIGNTVIPDGYKIMRGGKLDMMAIRRFGKNIYVDGNLEISSEDADALDLVESLYVSGDVRVADSAADVFFEKCQRYGKLTVYKGEWIDIIDSEYKISRELLEDMTDGVTFNILDSTVEVLSDVKAELLSEKIHEIILSDSTLTISLNQQNALRKKIQSKDGNINIREYECEKQPEVEPKKQDFLETKINCAYYKL